MAAPSSLTALFQKLKRPVAAGKILDAMLRLDPSLSTASTFVTAPQLICRGRPIVALQPLRARVKAVTQRPRRSAPVHLLDRLFEQIQGRVADPETPNSRGAPEPSFQRQVGRKEHQKNAGAEQDRVHGKREPPYPAHRFEGGFNAALRPHLLMHGKLSCQSRCFREKD